MDIFVFVLAIVAISTAGQLIKKWMTLQNRKHHNPTVTAELNERLSNMEERLQTLERIATDKKHTLKEEINALNDH